MSTPREMLEGVGPAAWANRPDRPDLTVDGRPKIVPISSDGAFRLDPADPNPIGMSVAGCDNVVAGVVTDAWVDRSEPQLRYLEVGLSGGKRSGLLPITSCRFAPETRTVFVNAITAAQFGDVPACQRAGQVTLLEEDKIQAFYAGGYLYATPGRIDSIL